MHNTKMPPRYVAYPEAVILFSGGLDSSTLLYDMAASGSRVIALSFNYGQRHAARELQAAKTVFAKMKDRFSMQEHQHLIVDINFGDIVKGNALTDATVDVPDQAYNPKSIATTVVPGRNTLFLTFAFAAAQSRGIKTIATAIHAGDHVVYKDCRPDFVFHANGLFDYLSEGVNTRIHAPYLMHSKRDIARKALAFGIPIVDTYSCYNGGPYECGVCATCRERRDALDFAYKAYTRGD